jgi:tetratricopeptide (TPR) repeat protein
MRLVPALTNSRTGVARRHGGSFVRGCHAHGFAWACVACMCCGCHLLGGQQPVSKQESASRQLSQRGISLVEQGDWKKGEENLAAAIKTFPGDPEAHHHYAEVLWHKGDRTGALAQMMEAIRLNGDDPQLLVRAGEMTLELGHTDDAGKLAGEALALNPRLSTAWTLRGEVAELRGQMQESLADLDRALEFQHDDKRTLFLVAELYRQQGRPDRALGTLETLRDCYPPGEEPQQILVLEGLAFSALRRFDEAVDIYNFALSRDPQSIDLCDRLAEAQLLGGRPREAAITIEQALTMDPSHLPSRALAERIDVAVRPSDSRRE